MIDPYELVDNNLVAALQDIEDFVAAMRMHGAHRPARTHAKPCVISNFPGSGLREGRGGLRRGQVSGLDETQLLRNQRRSSPDGPAIWDWPESLGRKDPGGLDCGTGKLLMSPRLEGK